MGQRSPPDADAAPSGAEHARDDLRLWLRLLSTAGAIEARVRLRLRRTFGTTLPRFDLMAQLARAPEGLAPTALSRRLMVSNGNVTGLVSRLVAEGLVERHASALDRRSHSVRLTARGRREFARMAALHETWIAEIFAGFDAADREALASLLARAKRAAKADA